MVHAHPPVLLELDGDSWSAQVDRVERWLATTRMLQSGYRDMLDSILDDVAEPHIKAYLTELRDVAREHEDRVDDLYRAFGREPGHPGAVRSAGATVLSKTRQVVGHLEGATGGAASGPWRILRELLLTNLDAISGFAATEQLGLALGNPAVTDITVPILTEKSEHQLQLQELLLEMAANAILYQRDT